MDTPPPRPGENGSNTGRLAGASSNTDILGTQPERRHMLVHHDAANAATNHMTQNAHLKIGRKTGSSKNKKQHAVGCESIHIEAIGGQCTVKCTAGIRRELRNEFIAACDGKPPWSTKAFVRTVRELEHHNVISCGIFAAEFPDKNHREWTKQALITLEEATLPYMVEATAEFHC
jgi:hypothetical protein